MMRRAYSLAVACVALCLCRNVAAKPTARAALTVHITETSADGGAIDALAFLAPGQDATLAALYFCAAHFILRPDSRCAEIVAQQLGACLGACARGDDELPAHCACERGDAGAGGGIGAGRGGGGALPPLPSWLPPAAPSDDMTSSRWVRVAGAARFDLEGDFDFYARALGDMATRAGRHAPTAVWHPANLDLYNYAQRAEFDDDRRRDGARDGAAAAVEVSARHATARADADATARADARAQFDKNYDNLSKMMDAGHFTGREDAFRLDVLCAMVARLDALGMAPGRGDAAALKRWAAAHGLGWADLASVLETNLLLSHLDDGALGGGGAAGGDGDAGERRPLRLLEVGGGYGRGAEAIAHVLSERGVPFHYVLLDVVPASLMYACKYLRRAFAGDARVRVGCAHAGDAYDPRRYELYVTTTWHYEALRRRPEGAAGSPPPVDAAINTESMQEMDAWQVHEYLHLMDAAVREGGLVYNSNSRRYIYAGAWRWPSRWRAEYARALPGKAWTRDHRTYIFRVGARRPKLEQTDEAVEARAGPAGGGGGGDGDDKDGSRARLAALLQQALGSDGGGGVDAGLRSVGALGAHAEVVAAHLARVRARLALARPE